MSTEGRLESRRTDSLQRDPTQPRKHFDEDELERLGQSMKAGQLNPLFILVCGIIIFGERRWRAATKVGIEFLDCIVLDQRPDEAELLLMRLAEDAHRKELSKIEAGLAIEQAYTEMKLPKKEIAERTSQSLSEVSKKHSLVTRLHPELRAAVEEEKLAPSVAYKLTQIRDEDKQLAIGKRFLAGDIDHKGVSRAVAKWKAGREVKVDRPIKSTRGEAHGITVRFLGANQVDEAKLQAAIDAALAELTKQKAARNGGAPQKKKGPNK